MRQGIQAKSRPSVRLNRVVGGHPASHTRKMSFVVVFEPEIPDRGESEPPLEIDWHKAYEAAKGLGEHGLCYVIDGRKFGYYPADVPTLLCDLLGLHYQLDLRGAQTVGLSGYTVLLAEISDNTVVFRDPIPPNDLVGSLGVAEVRQALRTAIRSLWAFLLSPDPRTG